MARCAEAVFAHSFGGSEARFVLAAAEGVGFLTVISPSPAEPSLVCEASSASPCVEDVPAKSLFFFCAAALGTTQSGQLHSPSGIAC